MNVARSISTNKYTLKNSWVPNIRYSRWHDVTDVKSKVISAVCGTQLEQPLESSDELPKNAQLCSHCKKLRDARG